MKQTELEKIAEEFGSCVSYEREEFKRGYFIECLFYNDANSRITARDDSIGTHGKLVSYQVDEKKLDSYLPLLKKSKTEIAREIDRDFSNRPRSKNPEKWKVYGNFPVRDFEDLPDLIRMHLE